LNLSSFAFSPSKLAIRNSISNTRLDVGRSTSSGQLGADEDEKPNKKPQAIVDSNVPTVVKTKRGGYAADVMKNRLERKKAVVFERPPERESGYYENQVCTLKDGHELSFNEYFLAENENDLVVCKHLSYNSYCVPTWTIA
jgi:hypothetical protein